jgi:hypothetical protein
MDLPLELVDLILQFSCIDDLTKFRMVSREICEQVKEYKGVKSEMVYPNQLYGLFQSFPKLKSLDLTKCEVKASDFHQFGRVEELKVSIRPLETQDIFQSCPHLRYLQLISHYRSPNLDLNLVFEGLTRLKILHLIDLECITDHALLYLPLLEELSLWDRSSITGIGLQSLPRLKRLSIETKVDPEASQIRDNDLVGLNLIQLHLVNHRITDQGILHLTQLKRLYCVKCPFIQGVGFTSLTKLQTVGLGESVIQDVSCFSNSKTLTFRDCQIHGNLKGMWKHLEKLRFYQSTFQYPLSVQWMTAPKLKQLRYENCPLNEDALRKTFGNRVQAL